MGADLSLLLEHDDPSVRPARERLARDGESDDAGTDDGQVVLAAVVGPVGGGAVERGRGLGCRPRLRPQACATDQRSRRNSKITTMMRTTAPVLM
ncbi:MAG: hypothetical protein H0U12_07290 [Thermoleophilaceae bacterium]|nr:hypothetical protein [Thermoleophilaceae bacterium]